jgi:thymidylate kinase
VLAKRWTESNVVYQQANGLPPERVLHFERHVAKPDHLIILDVPVPVAAQRLARSPRPQDAYEREPLLRKVRELYLNLGAVYPYGELALVDAARPPSLVNQDLRDLLAKLGF